MKLDSTRNSDADLTASDTVVELRRTFPSATTPEMMRSLEVCFGQVRMDERVGGMTGVMSRASSLSTSASEL